jgi:hypothetical protein
MNFAIVAKARNPEMLKHLPSIGTIREYLGAHNITGGPKYGPKGNDVLRAYQQLKEP